MRRGRGRGNLTPLETYLKWNERLNQYFLKDENAGRPVYLDPEPAMFADLEAKLRLEKGSGKETFLNVVRAVLEDPESRDNLFQRIDNALRRWRIDAADRHGAAKLEDMAFPPPVTAVLTATVLAAQQMDESSAGGKYVASTNYYTHLHDVLGVNLTYKDKVRRDFQVTEDFWEDFSWWLDEVDGRFGLPTARATSHRYVGLPMSQSLVRSADRRALRRMFHQFGLVPGEAIAPAEMVEIVGEWVDTRNSGASKELIAKWKTPEARLRITDVALSELVAWDGTVEQSDREASVTLPTVHQERVALAMVTRGRAGEVEISDVGFAMRRGNEDESWSIEHETGTAAIYPRPISATNSFVAGYELGVDAAEVLEREIVLHSESGRIIRRASSRIIVLVEDDSAGAYIEVRRAVSGARHRILISPDTPAEIIAELRRLLEVTAFSGNKDVEVDGIPEDWLVVDGFVPGQVPTDFSVSDELTALLASVTTQFHIRSGIRLPGRAKRWHSDASPMIVVTIGSEGGTYRLELRDLSGEGKIRILEERIERPAVLDVPGDVYDGDYRIELIGAKRQVVQSEVLRLRSGKSMYYEGWRQRAFLGHDERPVSAVRALPGIESPVVEGAIVSGEFELGNHVALPPKIDWARRHVRQPTTHEALSLLRPSATSCLVSGHHNFLFPAFKSGKVSGSWMTGVCMYCGAVRRTPTRHWNALKPEEREASLRRRGRAVPASESTISETVPVPDEIAPLPEVGNGNIPQCVVEDALVHVGSGDAATLLALTSQVPTLTEDHNQYLRDLAALATVEVSRDEQFRRDRWEVTPPTLIRLTDGRLGLAGAWSLEQLDALEERVTELGGHAREAESGSELTAVTGASASEILTVDQLEGVHDAGDAATSLTAYLPNLSTVSADLPRRDVTMLDGTWQMFLLRELAWIDVADWDGPGLYRRNRGYMRDYWYRTAEDVGNKTAAPVDVDLGKHLLGLDAGAPLLAYEPAAQALTVPLGARLPALYERAAVLCSGRVPKKDLGAFSMTYTDVPADIAATLYARMSS